jgi:hypothetical protein
MDEMRWKICTLSLQQEIVIYHNRIHNVGVRLHLEKSTRS